MKAKGKRRARKLVSKRVAKVRQPQPEVEKKPPLVVLKCKYCGKEVKNLAGLNGHLAVKHGEKKPPKVGLREKFANIDQRISTLTGEVKRLEMARMQQPLGSATPNIEQLAEALARWSTGTCGPSQRAFRQVMRGFLGLE
jgi:hypothetical protein